MRYLAAIILLLFIILVFSPSGYSAIIEVPKDYPTIQQAIDAAAANDTVLVSPGTYIENIDYKGKGVGVRSKNGPAVTVIDGNQSGAVVMFKNGENRDSVLHGFTITNGSGYFTNNEYIGGGIYCLTSSPLIENNIITKNITGSGYHSLGGGIYCDDLSSPIIKTNKISDNKAAAGPGIFVVDAFAVIRNNIIDNNKNHNHTFDSHAVFCEDSYVIIENNLICDNASGGIGSTASSVSITNCTIAENSTNYSDYAISCWDYSVIEVRDCIIGDNYSGEIEIGFTDDPSTLTIHHSDLKGGAAAIDVEPGCTLVWGSGMIDADPEFVTGAEGDYYLSQIAAGQATDSPCLDMGSDSSLILDMQLFTTRTDEFPDSGQNDMGYHYSGTRLECDYTELQVGAGGVVNFTLDGGSVNANRKYILMSSISGVTPGLPLPGGQAVLPINWDLFTSLIMPLLNSPVFSLFMDRLDGLGMATATFDTNGPLPQNLGGFTLYFAYALNGPWNFTSNPVGLKILANAVSVDDDYGPATTGWGIFAFDNIQDGLDCVANGGVVNVKNGTYKENIWVSRSITLTGEDQNNTIIEGETYRPIVRINADNVDMSGFCITTASLTGEIYGGVLVTSDNCTIRDNTFKDNYRGLGLCSAKNATITNNTFNNDGIIIDSEALDTWNTHTISNNTVNGLPIMYYKNGNGITVPSNVGQVILANCKNFTIKGLKISNVGLALGLGYCSDCIIEDNEFTYTNGVILNHSNNNLIYKNKMEDNYEECIGLYRSYLNKVEENTITSCYDDAISLEYADNNQFFNNNITYIDGVGICIDESVNNLIHDNTFQFTETGVEIEGNTDSNDIYENDFLDNEVGLVMEYYCEYNEVYLNTFKDNDIGVHIEWCYNNTIYNNNFTNNSISNAMDNGGNNWFKAYPLGGNYWDDHPGSMDDYSGVNQDILGSDDIIDLGLPIGGLYPYNIQGGSNQDDYPSIVQF